MNISNDANLWCPHCIKHVSAIYYDISGTGECQECGNFIKMKKKGKKVIAIIDKFNIGDRVNIDFFSKPMTVCDYDGERYKCKESVVWHRPITMSLYIGSETK